MPGRPCVCETRNGRRCKELLSRVRVNCDYYCRGFEKRKKGVERKINVGVYVCMYVYTNVWLFFCSCDG